MCSTLHTHELYSEVFRDVYWARLLGRQTDKNVTSLSTAVFLLWCWPIRHPLYLWHRKDVGRGVSRFYLSIPLALPLKSFWINIFKFNEAKGPTVHHQQKNKIHSSTAHLTVETPPVKISNAAVGHGPALAESSSRQIPRACGELMAPSVSRASEEDACALFPWPARTLTPAPWH